MAAVLGTIKVRILAQYGDIEPTEIGHVDLPVEYTRDGVTLGSLEEALTNGATVEG